MFKKFQIDRIQDLIIEHEVTGPTGGFGDFEADIMKTWGHNLEFDVGRIFDQA